MMRLNRIKGQKKSISIKVNGTSISSSDGKTTVSKDGKTTVIDGDGGSVAIINGQVFIGGKPVDTGKDR